MAQLEKCPEGHYYDPENFKSCPYCTIKDPIAKDDLPRHVEEDYVVPSHWEEKVLCPQCNCEINVGQKYCTKCGAAQESYVPTLVKVFEPDWEHFSINYPSLKSFFCYECGKRWSQYYANYCPECGSRNIYRLF